jgi:hypothetical protein
MGEQLQRAREYLEGLEAERQAALALSEQKAEEAKLIKARQEGFRAALGLFSGETSAGNPASGADRELPADHRGDERTPDSQEPRRRRGRRPIAELILRELSFSGQAMTAAQIARAIDYIPERTETALQRMERDSQVLRNEAGRWTIGLTTLTQMNGHALKAGDGMSPTPPNS